MTSREPYGTDPAAGDRRTGRWRVALAVVVAAVVATTVAATVGPSGSPDGTAAGPATTEAPVPTTTTPTTTATTTTTTPPPPACAPATVAAQAASVLVVGVPGVLDAADPLVDDLVALGVGGVLLNRTNVDSADQLRALTAGLAERFGGHVTIALDQEGGRVSPLAEIGLGGPSARRLGALDPAGIEAAGVLAGQEAAALGATMVLGPVADLDDGPARAVIGDRSFGADPEQVGQAALRYARGVRSSDLDAVVKHWPGHAMAPDTHLGAGTAEVDHDELVGRHVAAFLPLLDDGVEGVMVGHVTYPSLGELPASLNPATYRLLRETGYEGPAMTDALGMGSIHTRWGFEASPALALAAGADIALANQGGEAATMRDGIVAAVEAGTLAEDRLAEAAGRAAAVRPGC